MSERKIITQHVCPPIPIRSHDWCAYYDGREEGPIGWGATKQEALDGLEVEAIFAMTDEEVAAEAAKTYGSEEAAKASVARLRSKTLSMVDAHLLAAALREKLAADDALTAFLLSADHLRIGEAEWDRQHKERSERRRLATLASRAALAKVQS